MKKIVKKFVAIMLIALMHSATAGEWSPSDRFMLELTASQLRDRPSEEIVRHLNHPYPLAATGAAMALAEKGEAETMPIVSELVISKRDASRAAGVRVLIQWLPAARRRSPEPKMSEPMRRAIESAITAIEAQDVEPAVVHGDLAFRLGHDTPLARRIAICMTDTDLAAVRSEGLKLAIDRITDPQTRAIVARQVLTRDAGCTARDYARAGKLVQDSNEFGAGCLGAAARYLAEQAHSQRGMFSDSAMVAWFKFFKTHAREPEALASVPGIVRCYLRLPTGTHKGWVAAAELSIEAISALGPDAAPLIEQEINAQLPKLAAMSDDEIDYLGTTHDHIQAQAESLRRLIDALEKKKTKQR